MSDIQNSDAQRERKDNWGLQIEIFSKKKQKLKGNKTKMKQKKKKQYKWGSDRLSNSRFCLENKQNNFVPFGSFGHSSQT